MTVLAGEDRGYHELDPVDVLFTVLRCRLYEKPLELEAWVDSRIVGLPLDDIAARAPRYLENVDLVEKGEKPPAPLGVSRQCVSLRARNCERTIARLLALQPDPRPKVEAAA